MKTWFSVKARAAHAKTGAKAAIEIEIFDEIGAWGITAKDFLGAIKPHAGVDLHLNINSPGGSVFDALAIYNALRAHAKDGVKVHVKVLGVAASAASLIAMAGDTITMPENTFMMVHNPWAFAAGNADELRDMADWLDTVAKSLVTTYANRTGKSEDEIRALLAEDTWLTAQEAVDHGFATAVGDTIAMSASYELDRFPENIRAVFAAAKPNLENVEGKGEGEGDPAPQDNGGKEPLAQRIAALASSCGLSAYAATIALRPGVGTIEAATAAIHEAREIVALCAVAGLGDHADQYIKAAMTEEEARAALSAALADEADKNHTSNVRNSDTTEVAAVTGMAVWDKILPPAEQRND